MVKKTVLHELLAVEGDLKGEKEKIREETINTFSKKAAHFNETVKRLEMFDDSRKEEEGEERTAMVTTVPKKLNYMKTSFIKYWDVKLRKETANQEAKANIEIGDIVLAENVPVSFLLSMEEELKQLRKVYDAIPTLQPGYSWKKDETKGNDIWKMEYPITKHKTEKTIQHKILVQPTKEHPAQVKEWTEDKPIGKYILDSWTGMLSPAEKSVVLSKLDNLLRAVKKARQRANNQEVKNLSIGKIIFDYLK